MPYLSALSRLLIVWFILFTAPVYSAVFATLDRYSVRLGDAVELTLEAEQANRYPPNLAPLSKNFRIIGTRQMSVSSYTTGERRYTTRWTVRLRPLREGDITLPAITLGKEATAPLTLLVTPNESLTQKQVAQASALLAEIDRNEIYVNSQAVITFKHFHKQTETPIGVELPGIQEAEVRMLGIPKRYEGQLRGINYTVDEYTLALFPDFAGTVTVDSLQINNPDGEQKVVTLESPLEIAVIPKPFQEHPEFWIPADSLRLDDSLTVRTTGEVEQPLIRKLQLTAAGVLAETLPAIAPLTNELADIKLLNVTLEETPSATGITSRRTETIEIIPQERGELTLPPLALYWWNNAIERETQLSHPKRLVAVSPKPVTALPAAEVTLTNKSSDSDLQIEQVSDSLQWVWGPLLTLLGLAGSVFLLRRKKSKSNGLRVIKEGSSSAKDAGLSDEDAAWLLKEEQARFDQVMRACLANDAIIAEDALIEWARFWYPEAKVDYLSDLSDALATPSINPLIHDLAHHIEQQQTGMWRGDLIAEAVVKIRDQIR